MMPLTGHRRSQKSRRASDESDVFRTGIQQNPNAVTHFDRDFFHYDLASFEWICDGTSLTVERL
jgi:hypothetical protein